jgi:ribosomal protein S18 acetylase RimI-like enzyme
MPESAMLARLFRDLAPFQPTLIGTYPLGLQVDQSDIDIACTCDDLDAFDRAVRSTLSVLGVVARFEWLALPAVVAAFELGDLAVEVFGQALPVYAQRGFRHMVIEGQLLLHGGAALRARLLELKRGGMRTEPAFAQVLGLSGDPYEALLELETWSPQQLRARIGGAAGAHTPAAIHVHTGDRAELLPLFLTADDSQLEVAMYMDRGTVLVARDGDALVGHAQMVEDQAPATWELKSLAVIEAHRGYGLGRRLVEAGIALARERGASRVLVATAAADGHLLRFYQRVGFRMLRIERDVFTPAAGYPHLMVDGIRLLDRAWLDITW